MYERIDRHTDSSTGQHNHTKKDKIQRLKIKTTNQNLDRFIHYRTYFLVYVHVICLNLSSFFNNLSNFRNMIMNKNDILTWLTEFKCKWLPQNIINNDQLFQSLTIKINELEQLLNCK